MDWHAYVDIYCERSAPGFWNEPLNASTNAAFLVAALLVCRALQRMRSGTGRVSASQPNVADLWLLGFLIAAVGVASFAFHTVAARWAGALDSLMIALFMLAYAVAWAHHVARLSWRWQAVAPLVVIALVIVLGVVSRAFALPSLGLYGAALLALLMVAAWASLRRAAGSRALWAAAGVFGFSFTLRQLDAPLCADWPHGTHFAWHLLNALTLYLATHALIASTRTRLSES